MNLLARTDRSGVARITVLPKRVGRVFFASGGPRAVAVRAPHCVTLLGVLRASPTQVTG